MWLVRTAIGAILASRLVAAPLAADVVAGPTAAAAVDRSALDDGLRRLQAAIDPCGESFRIADVLARFGRCRAHYRIAVDRAVDRNLFDRASSPGKPARLTWNPTLRGALEWAADGTPAIERDPTASLLHELVHAVQNCDGLRPGVLELDAVRIENVYRRAAGLPQRTGYGDARFSVMLVPGQTGGCRSVQLLGAVAVQVAAAPADGEPAADAAAGMVAPPADTGGATRGRQRQAVPMFCHSPSLHR